MDFDFQRLNSNLKRAVISSDSVAIRLDKYKTAIILGTINTTATSLLLATRDYNDLISVKSISGASKSSITGSFDTETGLTTLSIAGNNSAVVIW